MPSSPSPTGSSHHRSTRCLSTKPHRLYLSTTDNALVDDGASTQSSEYKKRKPQHHKVATVPWERGAEYNGVIANKKLSDEGVMKAGGWESPADNQLTKVKGSSHHINIGQGARALHEITLEPFNYDQPWTREDHEACQLPPVAVAALHQADLMTYDEVHDWVLTTPGNRFFSLSGAKYNDRTSHHGRSTPDCDTSTSSWLLNSATSCDVNKDTRGK